MKIKIINDDGSITVHTVLKENYKSKKNKIDFISSSSKEQNALNIIESYYSNDKCILFDNTNKTISQKLDSLDLKIFDEFDFSMMFYTSGSTGTPIAALKTKANLEEEVKVFSALIKKYKIKQVIVTVPFIHIYGTLIGLLYPLLNDIDIVIKDIFSPYALLKTVQDNSLIVTTPVYIKALNKISDKRDLKSSLFISSTAPLHKQSAKEFIEKFNTNIIQLFGSTETGGIAYRQNDEELWTPLEKVEISVNKENELKVKSPFVSDILYENSFKNINAVMQTLDYIEQYENKFKLLGRSSKIYKIAGKRYSTIQIENILEEVEEISKAVVFVTVDYNSLKDEILEITLQSQKEFSTKQIKELLQSKLSNLKFPLRLNYVDKIPTNTIGKKLIV